MREATDDFKRGFEFVELIQSRIFFVGKGITKWEIPMTNHFLIAVMLYALGQTGAAAGENMLGGHQIKSLIAGKTVFLSTGYGFNMPLHYGGDGNVTGDGSGTVLGRYFAPKETGKWWVENNQLCQQWPSWYEGRTFCFTVHKTGSQTIYWQRDDGYSGTARISG